MAKTPEQKIAMMVDGAQPHCDEPLDSAMICSHAGSTAGALIGAITRFGGPTRTSDLPNPVLIAVGQSTIYAFKYKPRGFKMKLKKNAEVARWSRSDVTVEVEKTGRVSQFVLLVGEEEAYELEVTTALGGQEAFDMFIATLQQPAG